VSKEWPSSTSGRQPEKQLAPGEDSASFHIQAPRPLLEWFGAMSAQERGAALARLRVWLDRRVPAILTTYTEPPAESSVSPVAFQGASLPWPAGEALRWSGMEPRGLSAAQAQLLGQVRFGARLVRAGEKGSWWVQLPGGAAQRIGNARTVDALKRAGVLQPA
jgi:hypothetical protein